MPPVPQPKPTTRTLAHCGHQPLLFYVSWGVGAKGHSRLWNSSVLHGPISLRLQWKGEFHHWRIQAVNFGRCVSIPPKIAKFKQNRISSPPVFLVFFASILKQTFLYLSYSDFVLQPEVCGPRSDFRFCLRAWVFAHNAPLDSGVSVASGLLGKRVTYQKSPGSWDLRSPLPSTKN